MSPVHQPVPNPVMAPAKPKKGKTGLVIGLVALLLILGGGGGFYYWYYQNVMLPEKIDREAPRMYPMVNVQLRSSKMAGSDFNKVMTLPFGSELITYDDDGEWARVKYVEPSSQIAHEGFVASSYLLNKKDFYTLNSLLANDEDVREIVASSRVRKALLGYFKDNRYFGPLAADLQEEVGVHGNGSNQWQVIFHHGKEKPNEILFTRLTNKDSKYPDMGILIENVRDGDPKFLYFSFDDDETPHLLDVKAAPATGNISAIEMYDSSFYPTYTY